jgi:hypothetical protein
VTEPELSPLPSCEKCRREAPCVKVDTAQGERTICVATCWPLFTIMRTELKRQIAQLLQEHDANFFDEPTRPDIPILKEDP